MAYLYRRLELHLRDEGAEEDVRENSPVPGVQFGHLDKAGGRLVVKKGLFELQFIDMPGAWWSDGGKVRYPACSSALVWHPLY